MATFEELAIGAATGLVANPVAVGVVAAAGRPIQQRNGNMIKRYNRKIWHVRLTSGRAVLRILLREGANMVWQYRMLLLASARM